MEKFKNYNEINLKNVSPSSAISYLSWIYNNIEIDISEIKEYLEQFGFKMMRLSEDGILTNSSEILFSQSPEKWISDNFTIFFARKEYVNDYKDITATAYDSDEVVLYVNFNLNKKDFRGYVINYGTVSNIQLKCDIELMEFCAVTVSATFRKKYDEVFKKDKGFFYDGGIYFDIDFEEVKVSNGNIEPYSIDIALQLNEMYMIKKEPKVNYVFPILN